MKFVIALIFLALVTGLRAGVTDSRPRAWYLMGLALVVSAAFLRLGSY